MPWYFLACFAWDPTSWLVVLCYLAWISHQKPRQWATCQRDLKDMEGTVMYTQNPTENWVNKSVSGTLLGSFEVTAMFCLRKSL